MTLRQRILLLGLAAILSMVGGLGLGYQSYAVNAASIDDLRADVTAVMALSRAIHALQKERGLTVVFRPDVKPRQLVEQRGVTDAAVAELAVAGIDMHQFKADLERARDTTADALTRLDVYNDLVRRFLDGLERLHSAPETTVAGLDIAAYSHLAAAKDHLGQMRAIVGYWLETARDTGPVRDRLIRLKDRYDEDMRKFGLFASPVVRKHFADDAGTGRIARVLHLVSEATATGRPPAQLDETAWWSLATTAVDCLKADEDHALMQIRKHADVESVRLETDLRIGVFAVLAAAGVMLLLTFSVVTTLLRGLHHLQSGMEDIASRRDFHRRITAETPDELGNMAGSFNQVLEVVDRLLEEKEARATTDALTGIHNRVRFRQALEEELARKRRNHTAMALILFDVDHFKAINDSHGHNAGDEVLSHLAATVKAAIRATDVFARWGGEEFVLLLRDESLGAAVAVAEKLRGLIAATGFPAVARVTCSFGVALWQPTDTEATLVERADQALYEAKRRGRDRVAAAGSDTTVSSDMKE